MTREQVSDAPVRRFCEQRAVHVAIDRRPQWATWLRELEVRAAETDDLGEARAIAAEAGRILDAAFAEAGIERARVSE